MSVEGVVPAAAACAFLIVTVGGALSCGRTPGPHVPLTRSAPEGGLVAAVQLIPCGERWCERLRLGHPDSEPGVLDTLGSTERTSEIVWSKDGRRVAFLIDGHQLRIYDAATGAPAGQVDVVPKDAAPPTRAARGVTFSDNGAAITFDDCPRDRSGCRPGIVALR